MGTSVAQTGEESALRRARRHRNWTLDDAVAAIDDRCAGGSGATPSLVSAWERGKIRTSARYRAILCEVYDLPPEVLFAHQDGASATAPHPMGGIEAMRVVHPHNALLAAMIEVVQGAREWLAVTGSRSREPAYLDAILQVLTDHPKLVHYRVLYGPPRHQLLAEHLRALFAIRDPHDRTYGIRTLNLGIVDGDAPERFFVASESAAVVTIPSLATAEAFDSGVVFGPAAALGLVAHAREAWAASRRIESSAVAEGLTVVGEQAPSERNTP